MSNSETPRAVECMRISVRTEGSWLVISSRPPVGVEGEAIELARIRKRIVSEDAELWDALQKFLEMMARSIVKNALGEDVLGVEIEPAPEHERSGNA
jgi:hypothetical protein